MQKQIDKERYPLNTLAPLFRRPKMLFKIHRMQDAKLGDPVLIPHFLAWLINNDITITEVTDRCHMPHGAFLNAFPVDERERNDDQYRILKRWIKEIYGLKETDFLYGIYEWKGRQLTGT